MAETSTYGTLLEEELAQFVDPTTGRLATDAGSLVSCPICDDPPDRHRELFVKRGYRFALCEGCGLIFANPMVLPALNRPLYDNAPSFQEWARLARTGSQMEFDAELYRTVLNLARPLARGGALRCLDISIRAGLAAECDFLSGYRFDFLDFCGPTREMGRARLGEDRFFDGFDSVVASGKTYDLIVSLEAMEHFPDPRRFMEDVRGLLDKGGVFCGVLSNVESMLVRLLGEESSLFDGLYQKYFFHSGSLKRLFATIGLERETFSSGVSCSDRVGSHLKRMMPADFVSNSDALLDRLFASLETSLLGYKLFFAAVKK